jgi:hypothetical protein
LTKPNERGCGVINIEIIPQLITARYGRPTPSKKLRNYVAHERRAVVSRAVD